MTLVYLAPSCASLDIMFCSFCPTRTLLNAWCWMVSSVTGIIKKGEHYEQKDRSVTHFVLRDVCALEAKHMWRIRFTHSLCSTHIPLFWPLFTQFPIPQARGERTESAFWYFHSLKPIQFYPSTHPLCSMRNNTVLLIMRGSYPRIPLIKRAQWRETVLLGSESTWLIGLKSLIQDS